MIVSRRREWATEGKGKTVAAASLATRMLTTPMRRLGIRLRRKAKHLGIAFGPGAKTRQGRTKNSRWVDNAKRASRVIRLGRRLGRHVFRTGLAPAAMYGSVVAMPKRGTLSDMRRVAARAVGPTKGRSTAARLAINKCDPAWTVINRTVMQWASAVWDAAMCPRVMQHAWRYALRRAIETGKPSISAGGAAGALIDAVSQVEWRMPSYNSVRTREGIVLLLDQVPPRTVFRFLQDDYAIVSASRSCIATQATQRANELPAGHPWGIGALTGKLMTHRGRLVPWFEPIAQVLNSAWSRRQPTAAISSAAALAEGGWWPQARLFDHGLVADPVCGACGQQPGTLLHRLAQCRARAALAEDHCPAWLAKMATDMPHDPLFTDGYPLRPRQPDPPPAFERWVGAVPADGALAHGVAYTDGALRGTIPRARRAGWAFVVRQGTTPLWGKYGVCDESYTSVLWSELRALLEVLRISVGNICIHVDNSQVVDGVQLGKQWCTSSRREGADLWRDIWRLLDDMYGVRVVKVKAHLTFSQVAQGAIEFDHWTGNGAADLCAKKACGVACSTAGGAAMQAAWRRTTEWYRWAVAVAANWIEDTAPSGPIQAATTSGGGGGDAVALNFPRSGGKHELWANRDTTWCRLCGATSPVGGKKAAAVFRKACRGSLASRCRAKSTASSLTPSTYDDGDVPLAFLHEKFAERVHVPQMPVEDVPSPPVQSGSAIRDSSVQEERPPSVASDSDEDPFGHLQMGFDNVPGPPDGAEATMAEIVGIDRPPERAVGGSEAANCSDSEAVQLAEGESGPIHPSHSLRRTAGAVWCRHCGRSAITRIGVGLSRPCRGTAEGAYPARILRLRAGCHPVTGRPLRDDDVRIPMS